MKKTRKIIAILLTVLTFMSVSSAATPVFAEEVTEITETTEATSGTADTTELEENGKTEEDEILYEDTNRRDEYTKHFVMSNGLNKAVKNAQPIHYKENGEWIDIDNTLEYNQETDKYENQANSFKVNFDEKINSEELFSIENKGYVMSWKYNSGTKRNASVSKVEKPSKKDKKMGEHKPKANGKIKYDKFETDTNLEYIVTGTGVKENIILESYTGKNSFSFELKAKDLEFVKNEDKSISVVNQSGEEIFYIPAPFMFDADNNYCYDVDYSIEGKENKTILSVIADEKWLKNKERKYPVTIDPAISTTRDRSCIDSTFVASDTAYCNDNTLDEKRILSVGWDSSTYGQTRTLIKFTIPELNKSEIVVSASLNLVLHSASFYASTVPDTQIDAHIIKDNWDYKNTTWNTMPEIDDDVVLDYAHINRSDVGNASWKKFDITKAVKGWYDGTLANNGIIIKRHIETGTYANNCACAYF